VTLLREAGWRVVVFSTPMGTRTHAADVVLACPLLFNSVNKFAHGHANTRRGMGVRVMFDPAAPAGGDAAMSTLIKDQRGGTRTNLYTKSWDDDRAAHGGMMGAALAER